MFTAHKDIEEKRPTEKFNHTIKELLFDLTGYSSKKEIPTEIKQNLIEMIKTSHELTDKLEKEELNRPEFMLDYSLRKEERILKAKVEHERKEYKDKCVSHEQKIAALEKKLDDKKQKILQAKLNNILDDLHFLVKDEQLHLSLNDEIEAEQDKIDANKCCWGACLSGGVTSEIKASEKKITELRNERNKFDAKDPSVVREAIVAAYEKQQEKIEKEIDNLIHNPPSKPSSKLSNQLDEVVAKLEGGEEKHNTSISRDTMFQIVHVYVLYKHIMNQLTNIETKSSSSEEKTSNTLIKLKKIFDNHQEQIETTSKIFWCPDSHNKKVAHFYKAYINLSETDQKKLLTSDVSSELIEKLLPSNNVTQATIQPLKKL